MSPPRLHAHLLALLLAALILFLPVASLGQEASSPPSELATSRELVRGIIAQARRLGIPGDPQSVASRAIAPEMIRLGDSVLPGALAILREGTEDPVVLAGLLRGTVALTGVSDPQVCSLIEDFLVTAAGEQGLVPVWATLEVLRTPTGLCHDAIDEVAVLYRASDDRELRLETIDTLGWIGRTREDFELSLALAGEASDDCERRLIASAGLRILDRVRAASQGLP